MANTRFLGYAMVFDRPYEDGDVFTSGCLDAFLQEPNHLNIPMLNGHNFTDGLGRWVHMEIDHFGLKVIGELSVPIPYMTIHDIGLSIGPIDVKGPAARNEFHGHTANITRLSEISLVPNPRHQSCRVIMELPFSPI